MSDAERGYDLQLRLAKALGVRVLSPYEGVSRKAKTAIVSPGYLDADENASNAPFVTFKLKLPLDQLERLVERLELVNVAGDAGGDGLSAGDGNLGSSGTPSSVASMSKNSAR